MAEFLEKPGLGQRVLPLLRGIDLPLLLLTWVLCTVGLVAMYSSGYDQGVRFSHHLRNMLIAGALMLVVAQVPPHRLRRLAPPLYSLGIALLVAVAVVGLSRKGAQRWLDLGVVVIQPSELLKIALPLMLAWWFQRREERPHALDFIVAFVLLLIPVGLIVMEPDLGTAVLVLAAGLAVIFFAGLPWRLVLPPVLLGGCVVVILLAFQGSLCADGVDWHLLREYQRQRICTLLDPTRDPLGRGFHTLQAMIAIGSGGVYGKGFLQGTQTHLEFLPERTTDFIFAAFSEEFGLVGALVLLTGFALLVLRSFTIAASAPTRFERLLASSLGTIIFAYVFVNMGMVSGILPVVGVPLPFISYGGTAMVTMGLALGMLMSISNSRRLMQT